MRRFISILLGAAVLALIGSSFLVLPAAQAAPEQSALAQRNVNPRESTCVANAQKTAFPNTMLLGETTSITLSVKAVCAGEATPLHIVLVLDGSGSMAGQPTQQMKDAARKLVQRLDLPNNPATRVGIVEFNSNARTLCQLTNEVGRVISCIGKIGANGGTAIDRGIQEGLKVMRQGRNAAQGQVINEIMVVLSDGANNAGCEPVKRAARQAKSQGILVIAVCVGGGCDAQCMREVASSARYFYQVENAGGLIQVFERIRDEVINITLRQLTVVDILPDNMEYIANSSQPPADVSADQKTLEWQQNFVPKDGVTFTLMVRPQEVGFHPTNVSAVAEYRDNQNRSGTEEFPVPYVMVFSPAQIPTPVAPPPTPTDVPPTPTPTPTNTPTPTPTPTNTPTPTPSPIYLPILITEECLDDKGYQFADVALVLDMSTSMDRRTAAGRAKQQAVIEAAKSFVSALDFTPNEYDQYDQVAVVWFNDLAGIEQQLTNDEAAIQAALDNLPRRRAEGTRLDLAFGMGAAALPEELRKMGNGTMDNGQPIPDNIPVMIMLTDGLPNRVPFGPGTEYPECDRQECSVLASAQAAKDTGIRIYTIGVGRPDAEDLIDRVLPWLLRDCASEPEMFFLAPDAEEVQGIYSEIHAEFDSKCYNAGDLFGRGR